MIKESPNSQNNPRVSNTTLVILDPSESGSNSGANHGNIIQPKVAIGRITAALMPRIFIRLVGPPDLSALCDARVVI
jgi:hypothetical protein